MKKLLAFFRITFCEHEYELFKSHLYHVTQYTVPTSTEIIFTFKISCNKCGKYFEDRVNISCAPKATREENYRENKELALKIIKAKYNIKEKD